MVTQSQIVFACYSKACAPPPAGKGGSTPGGSKDSGWSSGDVGSKVKLANGREVTVTSVSGGRAFSGTKALPSKSDPKAYAKKSDQQKLNDVVNRWVKEGKVKRSQPSTKHNWTDPRDGTPADSPYARKPKPGARDAMWRGEKGEVRDAMHRGSTKGSPEHYIKPVYRTESPTRKK